MHLVILILLCAAPSLYASQGGDFEGQGLFNNPNLISAQITYLNTTENEDKGDVTGNFSKEIVLDLHKNKIDAVASRKEHPYIVHQLKINNKRKSTDPEEFAAMFAACLSESQTEDTLSKTKK